MGGAPSFANKLYFKEGHPENKNMSRWFGHALATCGAAQILASKDAQPSAARSEIGGTTQWGACLSAAAPMLASSQYHTNR